eukprot:2275068-Amphidinium_carterae.1
MEHTNVPSRSAELKLELNRLLAMSETVSHAKLELNRLFPQPLTCLASKCSAPTPAAVTSGPFPWGPYPLPQRPVVPTL